MCVSCASGNYCAGGTAPKTACIAGTWDNHGNSSTACIAKTDCVAGTRVAVEGDTKTNRTCSACATGSFSSTNNASSCTRYTTCVAGQYISTSGTAASDQACTACTTGFTAASNQMSCTPWSVCVEYQSTGTATTDALCKGGCSPLASYTYQIDADLWICAYDNLPNKTWPQTYGVCNEGNQFYMATVAPMTRRGLPSNAQIGPAMVAAAADGFEFIVTGQPVRTCTWNSANSSYEFCNGLGYIYTEETTQSGEDWLALTDGNSADLREWPLASPVSVSWSKLATLCMRANADGLAYVFEHRWR